MKYSAYGSELKSGSDQPTAVTLIVWAVMMLFGLIGCFYGLQLLYRDVSLGHGRGEYESECRHVSLDAVLGTNTGGPCFAVTAEVDIHSRDSDPDPHQGYAINTFVQATLPSGLIIPATTLDRPIKVGHTDIAIPVQIWRGKLTELRSDNGLLRTVECPDAERSSLIGNGLLFLIAGVLMVSVVIRWAIQMRSGSWRY